MKRYNLNPDSKIRRILDVGSGMNPMKDATHILDLDSSLRRVFRDKKFTGHNLNILPLPYPDSYFDRIYMNNVLHHLDIDDSLLFKEIYRILKIQGKLYTHDPNSFFIYHRLIYFIGIMPCDFLPCHKKHYSFRQLKLNLTNAGFKIFELENQWLFNPLKNFTNPHIRIIAKKINAI